MTTYRQLVTIEDPDELVLRGLPFRRGQKVEVVVSAQDERAQALQAMRDLFTRTQELPEAAAVTDEEIAAEVAAVRSAR